MGYQLNATRIFIDIVKFNEKLLY